MVRWTAWQADLYKAHRVSILYLSDKCLLGVKSIDENNFIVPVIDELTVYMYLLSFSEYNNRNTLRFVWSLDNNLNSKVRFYFAIKQSQKLCCDFGLTGCV